MGVGPPPMYVRHEMPVVRRGRRFAIGRGKATFKTKAAAERAQRAVKAKEAEKRRGK